MIPAPGEKREESILVVVGILGALARPGCGLPLPLPLPTVGVDREM